MGLKERTKEATTILIAILVLGVSIAFGKRAILFYAIISFFIIIALNTLTKKIAGYFLEINVKTKFWSWYRYGFRKSEHFRKPLPMVWVPMIFSLISQGALWWLAVLEFDVAPKTERVSKRHGLYRFTEVTEWHVGWIAVGGLITNLALGVLGYLAGFELFAKLSIFYAAWSIVPLANFDGTKIFFASRILWSTIAIITAILTFWAVII